MKKRTTVGGAETNPRNPITHQAPPPKAAAGPRIVQSPRRAVTSSSTDDYLDAEDSFASWLSERTARGPGDAGSADLYADYAKWAEGMGERPVSHKRFTRALEDHGIRRSRERGGTRFHGIRLVDLADAPAAQPARGVR